MANQIVEIFMRRDGLSEEEAKATLKEMRVMVIEEGEDPDEVLLEYGFEPDYIFDLLPIGLV